LDEDWRRQAQIDLAAFAAVLRQNYIYAAYPNPARWSAWFARTLSTVEAGLPLVRDEGGYRAVLQHLAAAFQDQHVFVQFERPAQIPSRWPGFLARSDDGTYRTVASRQAGIANGEEISTCDGKPISWWTATIAQLEVGLPDTLEITRNTAALRLFVDRGSPLRPRPTRCMIGGRSVALDWTPAPTNEINPVIAALRGFRAPEVSTRLIGSQGAWVKLGYFSPSDAAQAEAFHAAIRAAPSLRNKRFIVLACAAMVVARIIGSWPICGGFMGRRMLITMQPHGSTSERYTACHPPTSNSTGKTARPEAISANRNIRDTRSMTQ
jgi:hypothetical protein